MYESERDGDEIVVKSEMMFDVVDGGYTLVLSLRQARLLSEALLDHTMTLNWDLELEDG